MEPDSVSGTEGQVRSQQGLTVTPGDEMKQFRRDKKKDAHILRQAPAGTAGVPRIQSDQNLGFWFGF